MDYDAIFPESMKKEELVNAHCFVAAAFFSRKELESFGVRKDAYDFDSEFVEMNEYDKFFAFCSSPLILEKFYDENTTYFKQEYWRGITADIFICDAIRSATYIKNDILEALGSGHLPEMVEPLDDVDEKNRQCKSIRVKLKRGIIMRRFAFRLYAIEIEEGKCYLITGGTVKIVQEMKDAPNTKIELAKINYVFNILANSGINTKQLFIDYLFD
jgi:hypothetical protein